MKPLSDRGCLRLGFDFINGRFRFGHVDEDVAFRV